MDAFETIVAATLGREGFWARTSYKVELTAEEKRRIDRPTCPRWEIDVVAYKPGTNSLLVVECKSYLDSVGVKRAHFKDSTARGRGPYKLFTEANLRTVVLAALVRQLRQEGLCLPDPSVQLCLAAGNIATEADRTELVSLFAERGWQLWDEYWFRDQLRLLAGGKYTNEVASVVAKLLLRVPDAQS